ncbi:hypothetical protein EDD33_1136 [Nocardioides aurantiacus]|uniref:Uncharacterized protein n=1 Tax=Nocardioides aurantiacus TaxID=86796 RepID=A0A3N2CS08_9ACTN|nr:hypothetical protein EDD33_1136 [Nocardioides aurantiacus]
MRRLRRGQPPVRRARPTSARRALLTGLLRGVIVWALFAVSYVVPTVLLAPSLGVRLL